MMSDGFGLLPSSDAERSVYRRGKYDGAKEVYARMDKAAAEAVDAPMALVGMMNAYHDYIDELSNRKAAE